MDQDPHVYAWRCLPALGWRQRSIQQDTGQKRSGHGSQDLGSPVLLLACIYCTEYTPSSVTQQQNYPENYPENYVV